MKEYNQNALPIDYQLEEFKIISILGSGGFGITYKAIDTNLDKEVAIKEYLPNHIASRVNYTVTCSQQDEKTYNWGLERFLDEAKLLAKFNHINIVRITRLLKANNSAYFVMDFVSGETLSNYLEKHDNKIFTQDEILSIIMPILEGLKAVHQKKCLHRDIAPDNIFLRKNDFPMLIDFGSARQALGQKYQNITAIIKQGYSPPEQYTSSSKQDETTDLYAISAVMFHLLTGNKPPESTYRQVCILNGENDPLENIQEIYKSRFDKSFLDTIFLGLSIRQKDRIQSIEELQKALILNNENLLNYIIIDNLMWQDEPYKEKEERIYLNIDKFGKKEFGKVLKWKNALKYAQNLKLGEYNDWRLPTIKELKNLYKNRSKLKNITLKGYWSSETCILDNSKAWVVYFDDDGKYYGSKEKSYYIRCVRNNGTIKEKTLKMYQSRLINI